MNVCVNVVAGPLAHAGRTQARQLSLRCSCDRLITLLAFALCPRSQPSHFGHTLRIWQIKRLRKVRLASRLIRRPPRRPRPSRDSERARRTARSTSSSLLAASCSERSARPRHVVLDVALVNRGAAIASRASCNRTSFSRLCSALALPPFSSSNRAFSCILDSQ